MAVIDPAKLTLNVATPDGHVQTAKGVLNKTTVNRYLQQWGYDRTSLSRQPAAVRFQAEHSNDCWQFDMSPSDLKHLKKPSWVREDGSPPTLMLFSAVDDRSGVASQEYRCVYVRMPAPRCGFCSTRWPRSLLTMLPFREFPA
jgi:hypothetical protein